MNKAIYNINFSRYIQRLLPAFEKNEFNIKWLVALIKPLQVLNKAFREFTIRARADCFGNSQVGVLEARLNIYYDPVLKRIRIENHTLNNPVPLSVHFSVFVPTNLPYGNADTVRAFVQQYILLDKFFQIVIV